MRGRFITFEGGEGTGKSTQVAHLAASLRERGLDVDVTREPGGTPLAERLRNIILSGKAKAAGPEVEAALFAAARSDHLNRRILPQLGRGAWVVCDRFADSTRVYQSISGADQATILQIEAEALGGFYPDLTVVLDINVDLAAGRAAARRKTDVPDRFESEGMDFHHAVRSGFLALADADPGRFVVVDADGTVEEVAGRVLEAVQSRLVLAGAEAA